MSHPSLKQAARIHIAMQIIYAEDDDSFGIELCTENVIQPPFYQPLEHQYSWRSELNAQVLTSTIQQLPQRTGACIWGLNWKRAKKQMTAKTRTTKKDTSKIERYHLLEGNEERSSSRLTCNHKTVSPR